MPLHEMNRPADAPEDGKMEGPRIKQLNPLASELSRVMGPFIGDFLGMPSLDKSENRGMMI